MKKTQYLIFLLVFNCKLSFSQIKVSQQEFPNSFCVARNSAHTYLYTDSTDDWLIQKSAQLLQQDIESITGNKPILIHELELAMNNVIIIGSSSKSTTIQNLAKANKINISQIQNKWEAYQIAIIQSPTKKLSSALVITGSDKRGTAYGVFEISKAIGVSPWYWWADVPAKKKSQIYIKNAVYEFASPSVKYRGIFINDEAPAFSGWTKEKFGGVNHLVYEKMFELLLRLKANYLWPAMWGNAFSDDDKMNPILADKYGIVMGNSHHEPMLRAQQEWKRYGTGAWNYNTNDSVLRSFWRKGIENMGSHESIITIGMRGDGDEPMTQGTAISLLEKIVSDQRKIIEEVTKKPASEQPQLWALYKEVQEYYDKGMRVPDDITLLLCDDNWGNIRKLPKLGEPKKKGGYGIYYHFDYVGDPRNYKWINTNNISRVWEQMHLAYEYGVDQIWIVNVGDLKPMEFPISFFLDYAWDTKKWNPENLMDYYTKWSEEQFGQSFASEIGKIMAKYAQLSSRRKPELINEETFSFENYNELIKVTKEFDELLIRAEKINHQIPSNYKDAYFELVLHPIKAFTNLIELYATVAQNKWAAKNYQSTTNDLADKAKQLYLKDSMISVQYHQLANGKWNHMMDQTHIGYTYWQQPLTNKMPFVKYISKDSIQPTIEIVSQKTISSEKMIPLNNKGNMFYERDGYAVIYAEHFTKSISNETSHWKIIPNIGRTNSGVSNFPSNVQSQALSNKSPYLAYEFYTYDSNTVKVNTQFCPTLNFQNTDGLKCAISIDHEKPQIVTINEGLSNQKNWGLWVANNIITKTITHQLSKPGKHVVKYWMIDPGIVLQKIILDFGGLKPSYLGPDETKIKK